MSPKQLKKFEELDIYGLLNKISDQYNVKVKRVFKNQFLKSVLTQYEEKGTLSDKQIQGLVNMHNGITAYEAKAEEFRKLKAAAKRSRSHERNNSKRRYSSRRYSNEAYEAHDHPLNDLGSMGYLN